MHHVILYYTLLYSIIPCYTLLYPVILYYTLLYSIIPCYTLLYPVILYYTLLYSMNPVILYYTLLYSIIPCYTVIMFEQILITVSENECLYQCDQSWTRLIHSKPRSR